MKKNIREILGPQYFLSNPDTWIKTCVKDASSKYYEYIYNHIYEGMIICNKRDKIIKGLEETYKLGGAKGMFDES